GIAHTDAHQNVGPAVRLLEGGKARFEDALGKKLLEADVALIPPLAALAKDKKAGDTLFELRQDPYENSLRHVGTHVLLKELSEQAVSDALTAGRAFVAFDWLADATGFDFAAIAGDRRHEMGSRLAFTPNLTLRAQAPLPVRWKVLRNGKVISESKGRTLEVALREAGNYRVEAWLHVAG